METRLTALLLALSMMLGLVSCGGQACRRRNFSCNFSNSG